MEFRVLGRPLVTEGRDDRTPGRRRELNVLAALLLRRGRPVTIDELIDGIWGDDPPPTARTALHGHISSLRRRLGTARIATVGEGYRFAAVDGDSVDADRLEGLRSAAAVDPAAVRAERLREALELFRGMPFEGVELADGSTLDGELRAEAARLSDLRLVLEEERAGVELDLGRAGEVIPRLQRLAAEQPLRESLRTPLMLALYRSGRQADALRVAQDVRRVLAEELGVEPGPALVRLEAQVLAQDPALAGPLATAGSTVGGSAASDGAASAATGAAAAGLATFLATDAPADAVSRAAASAGAGATVIAASSGTGPAAETGGKGMHARWGVVRFSRAVEAAGAAAGLIRSSGSEDRPRVGLHSAAIDAARGTSLEPEIDRARHLARAANPGQVILSRSTREFLAEAAARPFETVDLGEHRLADLRHAQPLYQLVAAGLPVDFPPPRTLDATGTNLPIQEGPLIGRTADLAAIVEVLRDPRVRLATLVGPGGAGKTRLALHASADLAEEIPGGVDLVALESLSDPELVPAAIAAVVGVQAAGGEAVLRAVVRAVAGAPRLLVLDNFEHLIPAVPVVEELLAAVPELKVLATSRAPLRVPGERTIAVPRLELPEEPAASGGAAGPPSQDELGGVAAVALFTTRARTVAPEFAITPDNAAAVTALLRTVDGLPLAIELAASRVAVLSPAAIVERIGEGLQVLGSSRRPGPDRHRALEATIGWSHDLLEPAERELFADLAVFAGGWTLQAAERIAEPGLDVIDGLAGLAEDSLVRVVSTEEPIRFGMLETIREFAASKLTASGRRETVVRRHAAFLLALAEEAVPHLRGNPGAWLGRLELERDNFRAALDRLTALRDHQAVAALAGALWRFWYLAGDLAEGRVRLEAALAEHAAPTAPRARALIGAAVMAVNMEDNAMALERAAEGLRLHHALGDAPGAAYSQFMLGTATANGGDLAAARPILETALAAFRDLGDEHSALLVARSLAGTLAELGERAAAEALYQETLRRARNDGNARLEASNLAALAMLAFDDGRLGDARWMLRESLTLHREQRDRLDAAVDLGRAARTLSMTGRPHEAARIAAALGAIVDGLGVRRHAVAALADEARARSLRQLSEEELGAAELEGSRMDLAAALDLALATLA